MVMVGWMMLGGVDWMIGGVVLMGDSMLFSVVEGLCFLFVGVWQLVSVFFLVSFLCFLVCRIGNCGAVVRYHG